MLPSLTSITAEEKQNTLESILQSRTFARSEQLRNFLSYVCSMEIAGRGEEITEYRIAVEALGRPVDYTGAEDSTVRGRAYALRLKLEELYTNELPQAPVRIEFIKGSYRPRFTMSPMQGAQEGRTADEPEEPIHPVQGWSRQRTLLLLALPALALVFVAGVLFGRMSTSGLDPVIVEAWGPILKPDVGVLVSLATHDHLQVRARTVKPQDDPTSLDAPAPVYQWYARHFPIESDRKLYLFFSDTSTRFGDGIAAAPLLRTISAAGARFQIFPQRMVTPAMFRDRSAIVIGQPENSPTVQRLLRNGVFQIAFDESIQKETIVGPLGGGSTPKTYTTEKPKPRTPVESYGLITMLPGQGAATAPRRIAIFSGSHSSCTAGATEFFTSPAQLSDLRRRFRAEGHATFPQAYQVVVRCLADGVLPLAVYYQAHSVLQP